MRGDLGGGGIVLSNVPSRLLCLLLLLLLLPEPFSTKMLSLTALWPSTVSCPATKSIHDRNLKLLHLDNDIIVVVTHVNCHLSPVTTSKFFPNFAWIALIKMACGGKTPPLCQPMQSHTFIQYHIIILGPSSIPMVLVNHLD